MIHSLLLTGLRTCMFLRCKSQRSFTEVVFLPVYEAVSFRWRGTEPASPPSQDASAVPFPPWLPSFPSGIKPQHDCSISMTREWLSDHMPLSSFSFSLVTHWTGGFISTSLLQKYLRERMKQKKNCTQCLVAKLSAVPPCVKHASQRVCMWHHTIERNKNYNI